MALNLALNLAFMVPLQHLGPPLATSLAAGFNLACLAMVLRRRGYLALDARLRRRAPRMLAAAAVMALALALTQHLLFTVAAPAGVLRAAALAALVAVGMVAYFAAGHLLGAFDLREALRPLTRHVLRTRDGSAISPAPDH